MCALCKTNFTRHAKKKKQKCEPVNWHLCVSVNTCNVNLSAFLSLQSVVRVRRKRARPQHGESGPVVSFWGYPPCEQRWWGGVVARPSPQPPTSELPWGRSHPQPQEVRLKKTLKHFLHHCSASGKAAGVGMNPALASILLVILLVILEQVTDRTRWGSEIGFF